MGCDSSLVGGGYKKTRHRIGDRSRRVEAQKFSSDYFQDLPHADNATGAEARQARQYQASQEEKFALRMDLCIVSRRFAGGACRVLKLPTH